MTAGGWIMLGVSWVGITALTVFAVWRTLRARPRDLAAPLDLEAEIEEDESRKEKE